MLTFPAFAFSMRTSLRACLAALLLAGLLSHVQAQVAAPVRLDQSICPVDTTPPLAGQLSPHGAYITRQALQAAETAAPLDFEVALKMHNFAELQARVAHGQRISPQEMATKYLPTAAEYAQVTAWLNAQGFAITRQGKSRIGVFARGTVGQIQTKMQVTFARVSNGSTEFTSAITAPTVPATLAPLLVGINGLQPHIRFHKLSILGKSSLTGTNPPYTPAQVEASYNATPLYNLNINGAGQTIAIVIDTFPSTSDLTSFWDACGISQSLANIDLINVNNVSPLPTGTDTQEVTLDTEWSSAIAPAAKIRVYAAGSLSLAAIDATYQQVYDDATATPSLHLNQMSMSFGLGEQYEGQSQADTDDQHFVMLASAGVSLFAASGDAGATPDDTGHNGTGTMQVEMPASDPNVTGVGGTSLTLNSDGSVNTEVVWNSSQGATGGGASGFFTRPSWQTGTGVPTGTMRLVPDISSAADPNKGAFFVWDGSQAEIGGTSWSSPTWVGFCALINQSRTNAGLGSIGQLAPQLYQFLGTPNLRDITSGNNKFESTQGFTAGVGYDRCTGVGVPNVGGLASSLTPATAPSFTDGPASGEVGTAYSFTYNATGQPTPTFDLASGSPLPNGITLTSAGVLSGTPTQSGVFTGTVTATNGISPNANQVYSLTIGQPPAITNGPPPAATTVNTAYTFIYTTTGFPAPTLVVTAGGLPTGLSLSSSGAITGTTTLAGAFTGTITASNGSSPVATQGFSINVDQTPAFTSTPINANVTNTAASNFTLQASGFPAPTFAVTSGSLPPGLTLSSSGQITGTALEAGTFTGTITASNGVGMVAMQSFTITVNVATDTPTLPPPALALLAVGLLLAASHLAPQRST